MYKTHVYEKMNPRKRPQDPGLDLEGWTFTASEHGGDYADAFPNVITGTDEEGRSCKYQPISEDGKVVDSQWFESESSPGSRPISKFVNGEDR